MWDGFTDIKALTTAAINNTGVPNIISIHCCESYGYFWVQVQCELVTWAGWQKTGVAKETGHNGRGGWLSHRGRSESRQQCLDGGPAFVFLPLWLCQSLSLSFLFSICSVPLFIWSYSSVIHKYWLDSRAAALICICIYFYCSVVSCQWSCHQQASCRGHRYKHLFPKHSLRGWQAINIECLWYRPFRRKLKHIACCLMNCGCSAKRSHCPLCVLGVKLLVEDKPHSFTEQSK